MKRLKTFKQFENTNEMVQILFAFIKDKYDDMAIAQMYDEEILEWVETDWEDEYENEYDAYINTGRGEAENAIVTSLINEAEKEYQIKLDTDHHCELYDMIKEQYDVLSNAY